MIVEAFSPDAVHRFAARAFRAVAVSREDADLAADVLIDADMRGVASHGIMRLPLFVDRLRRGVMVADAKLKVVSDRSTVAHVDGGLGLGPVSAARAMDMAVAKARGEGVGLVLLRRASHFGTAGFHARRAAAAGMVGIAASNTAPMLVPPGGSRAAVGNNPLAIAFPDGQGGAAFVTDLAFSAASMGKIMLARAEGRPIPPDWAMGSDGEATTDPTAAIESGLLRAMGGAKGFAFALAVEALTGLLSGSDFSAGVPSIYRNPERRQSVGQFFLAIDPTTFLAADDYSARVASLRDMVASAAAPGCASPRLPGDRGEAARRAADAILLPPAVAAELARLAAELDLPPLQPRANSP